MAEGDPPFPEALPFRQQLKEPGIGVVDHQGRRPGKVTVGPGVRQNVHGDPRRLQAALSEIYGLHDQIAVGVADEAVFMQVELRAALACDIEIIGQKVEGCPDARDILSAYQVSPGVSHLHGKLGRGGGKGPAQL